MPQPRLNSVRGRSSGDVDRVRDATDIVRLIGEHVALKAKGREYVGLCPFHDDHRPSMNVVPAKQIFHCFVCGAGGNAFSFVQKYHKMDFKEALHYLAEKAGVALTPWRPERGGVSEGEAEGRASRADLLNANAFACEFFKLILKHESAGAAARAVVQRRAIAPEMVEQFAIGASPDDWEGLVKTIRKKEHPERLFIEAGLLKTRDSGGCYDALRNRLIFPIHDAIGRVIAFGGRKIKDEDEPKYLNSPETRLFNKSATLYGLHHASKEIQRRHTALITEGYTDTIACHQAGFTNAVATLGTALTREHAAVLRRVCGTVVLLFDGDEAGQRAADRAVPIFFAEPLDVKICTLNAFTDAKDPDELLKRPDGRETFERALAGSIDLIDYRFRRLRQRLAGAGMAALSRAIDDEIAQYVEWGLADVAPVRQAMLIKKLASLAGVDEEAIKRAIPRGRAPKRTIAPADAPPTADDASVGSPEDDVDAERLPDVLAAIRSTGLGAHEHLLGCVLVQGELWSTLPVDHGRDLIAPVAYRSVLLSRLAQVVDEIAHAGDAPDLAHVLASTDDLVLHEVATTLHQRVEGETEHDRARLWRHFNECVRSASRDVPFHAAPPAKTRSMIEAKDGEGPRGIGGLEKEDDEELLALIEVQRKAHAALGADRRKLPKPS